MLGFTLPTLLQQQNLSRESEMTLLVAIPVTTLVGFAVWWILTRGSNVASERTTGRAANAGGAPTVPGMH